MLPDIDQFKVPSPSPEGIQIMEMISEVDVDLSILGDVISRDPVLAATVMKYANSPLYRRVVEIKSVKNAVNLLGLKNVATAILIATMRGFATPPNKASEALWEHSMGVAALAKIIARHVRRPLADKIEFIATIHDIGAMFLAANLGEQYEQLVDTAISQQRSINELELEIFNLDHDNVTPKAISKLKLPDEFSEIILNFHTREPLTQINSDRDSMTAILALAHYLEAEIHGTTRALEQMPESRETLCTLLSISDDDLADIAEEFEELLNNGL